MNVGLLPLGWVHFAASTIALVIGPLIMVRSKGTPPAQAERQDLRDCDPGREHHSAWYLSARNLLLRALVRSGGPSCDRGWRQRGTLKGPRAGWMHLHLTCMLMSFHILVGGGVNEAFLRVNFLRRLVPSLNAPVVGIAHFTVMIFVAVLIAYFNCITLIRLRPGGTAFLPCSRLTATTKVKSHTR
jgi:hypothetical protein